MIGIDRLAAMSAMGIPLLIIGFGAWLVIRSRSKSKGSLLVGSASLGLIALLLVGSMRALDVFLGHASAHTFF